MPYIGNNHVVGDHTSNFKVLDDISSHTATFDGSASAVVSTSDETIRVANHRFVQGQRVTYNNGGGGNIGGLTSGTAYYVIFNTTHTIKLATSLTNANNLNAINLSSVGSGTSHTLTVAFDGTNTKFKITHSSGSSPRILDATQLQIAINNVIQRPNKNDASFTEGYAVANRNILFKTAPTSDDIFWGSLIGEAHETFDISDNKVDSFTADGTSTNYTLSKNPPNKNDIDVTLDGVTQHISAFSLNGNVITFTAAPANGISIQVKHIGFAGASTSGVTGFYGRAGNVALTANDHITTGDITSRNINASGIVTAVSFVGDGTGLTGVANTDFVVGTAITMGTANFTGNVTIGGTLTYEDVTNIDSVGIITARDGIDCNADLDVDGHTNLDNVSIAGVTTTTDDINLPNDKKINFGSFGFQMYQNTSASNNAIIKQSASGQFLRLQTNGGALSLEADSVNIRNSANNAQTAIFSAGGKTSLYYNSNLKLTTETGGVNISGIVTATNIVCSGTNGIKLPIGTTGQRVNTTGTLRYNSTLGLPEYYNGSAWVSIDSPPGVNSVSPTEVESAAGGNITFTINGERFSIGANVRFISNTGTELTPSSVTRVSASQLTAVIAKNSFVNGQEPYDVKVINSSGLASTLADQINVDNAPAWVTSAGSLGSHVNYASVNVTVSATDAEGDTVTYSVVSGSLPSGLSLNSSTGAITGTMGAVGSSTTVNFTLRATAGGKTADRAFSFVQSGPSAHAYSYTGSTQTFSVPSGLSSLTAYMWGAGGGGGGGQNATNGRSGGTGGYAKAVLSLSGLSTLYLVVGQGGSPGAANDVAAGGGGGLTGIFDDSGTNHGDVLLLAGAGGGGSGGGGTEMGPGGGGGGANNNGRDGLPDTRIGQRTQGLAGTTSAGGAGGNASNANYYTAIAPQTGSALQGGNSGMQSNGTSSLRAAAYGGGGRAYNSHNGYYMGGAGGSGYYGGGGGTCGYGGGGGGGSGYAKGSVCSSIVGTNGNDGSGATNTAAPENSSTYYASGIAQGGGSATNGGNGRIVLVY